MTTADPAMAEGRLAAPKELSDKLVSLLLWIFIGGMTVAILLPLGLLLIRSFRDPQGAFVGLRNYQKYFESTALFEAFFNSVFVSLVTALIVIPIAFLYAYGLSRTSMRWKGIFRAMIFVPLLMPGLLKAIALVYLFGNQGILKGLLLGHSVYGPIGIILASVLWTFPHAVLVIGVALMNADRRLYQAAEILNTSSLRTFLAVTWPACRYGVITAFLAVFVMVFTDFGIAKVIGGDMSLLATDIYKEVVGQQNFEMGAVISIILLIPAVVVFVLERLTAGRQSAQITGKSLPFIPKPHAINDGLFFSFCLIVAAIMVLILGMAQFAALIKFWPYNLNLTLSNYLFDLEGVGWENFWNSLKMSLSAATLGTIVVFIGATLVEKARFNVVASKILHMLALLPMAIPGLVLGLSYLMFINDPRNPLEFLYGSMSILVISTTVHLYTVPHLTALTGLKGLSREIDMVNLSLRTPIWRSFLRVILPTNIPTILDIWLYIFLRAMTTLSAAIFLYTSQTKLAAIAVIHVDETGNTAAAAALGMLVVYACLFFRLMHYVISHSILRHFQAWRGTGKPA